MEKSVWSAISHTDERAGPLVLAAVGLLLLQVGHDLGLHLGLVGLTLEQFQDEVGCWPGAGLVTIHVGVAHDGLRGAGVGGRGTRT